MYSRIVSPLLVLLGTCAIPAQDSPKPPDRPKSPVILKQEVDGLVRALRQSARPDGSLGDGSCRQTAMVLTAAGHCHRYYHVGDGPWLRRAMSALIVGRRGDGSFADEGDNGAAETTRWVLAAMQVMDPKSYESEIESGRSFLASEATSDDDPFGQLVEKVRDEAHATDDPGAALTAAGRSALQALPPPGRGAPDPAIAARVLVDVVSCQAAARPRRAPAVASPDTKPWMPAQERGFSFLRTQQEAGVFSVEFGGQRYPDVGLTGIGLAALQTKPAAVRSAEEDHLIEQGLSWLLTQQGTDGAFGQTNVNYSTCSAVMALAASKDPRFGSALARAQNYILALQNTEGRDYSRTDRDYGSIGYGGDERGDLSNLQFALEALRSSGLDEEHEAFAKAMVFLQRTQNLTGFNDFKGRTREGGVWREVRPGDDGGSAYYPGNSPAGYLELPDGTRVPRSYGSMTYALLKAYTLCGLPASDPRVQAAVSWIQEHWTVEENPGADPALGSAASHQGLYYYYMAMAQALDTVGLDGVEVRTQFGPIVVNWRSALAEQLEKSQREDGSWLNERNGRWWENQPLVCTVYSMLALARCSGHLR